VKAGYAKHVDEYARLPIARLLEVIAQLEQQHNNAAHHLAAARRALKQIKTRKPK